MKILVRSQSLRWFLVAIGWFFVLLGIIGAFLPIVPTTPFLILAGICFSKGSPKWHDWLLKQPYVGKALNDWEKYGVIRRPAKVQASLVILPVFTVTLVFVDVTLWVRVCVAAIGLLLLGFIWTRPATKTPKKLKK